MAEDKRKQAIEWLRDWSKWLISINFAAVTGCTVILQVGVKGLPRPFLLLAIGAFSVSVVISVAVVGALSTAIEGPKESGQNGQSILDHALLRGVSIRMGTRLQFASLIAGILLFLAWVALSPAPPATDSLTSTERGDSQSAANTSDAIEGVSGRLEAMDQVLHEIRRDTNFTQTVREQSLDTVSKLGIAVDGLHQEATMMLDVHQFAKLRDEFDLIEALLGDLERTLDR